MSATAPQPRPGILDLSPYVGGEGRMAAGVTPVRLASNENPRGCSPLARAAYLAAADDLNRYPDGNATALRAAIAEKYGFAAEQIVCGAGSDQLISMIMRAYAGPGDEVVHSRHGFLMYSVAAKAVGATPVAVDEKQLTTDIDAVIAAVTAKTKIIMLANPNNPTGSLLPESEIARLIEKVPPHVVIVLDAAYAEYVEDASYNAGEKFVSGHDNVVMLRTFSKVHGLAALRLGWGYFPLKMADVMNRLRGPFNVSVPAQAAGIAALTDDEFVEATVEKNTRERARLAQALDQLGLGVNPSAGNFLLVDFGNRAEAIRLALKERGIFVRQMGAYELPSYLRITVGLKIDNDQLIEALEEILGG